MKRIVYVVRQTAYTAFSFCYFLGLAMELTVRGFFVITLGGKTDGNKLKYHRILQRKARFVVNHIPGTTFSFVNTHGETFQKPSVVISNHQSHLDLMAIMIAMPTIFLLPTRNRWQIP